MFLDIYAKALKTYDHTKTRTQMSKVALCIIIKHGGNRDVLHLVTGQAAERPDGGALSCTNRTCGTLQCTLLSEGSRSEQAVYTPCDSNHVTSWTRQNRETAKGAGLPGAQERGVDG